MLRDRSAKNLVSCLVLIASALLISMISVAQEPSPQFYSGAGHWGPWQSYAPPYPGLASHAACGDDVQLNNHWMSNWVFEFRSTYQQPMDMVYKVEFGDTSKAKATEGMDGPFMFKLHPGINSDEEGESVLLGKCSEHSTAIRGLHFSIICVVPHGQDAPCFHNPDGTVVAERPTKSGTPVSEKPSQAEAQRGSTTQ